MKNPWIFPAISLAVGAVGGFISGKNTQADTNPSGTENTELRTRASKRSELSMSEKAGMRSKRVTGLDEISRLAGSSTRIQALIEFYSGLTPEQLELEAAKLQDLPMSERIMGSFLLFGRWAEVDAKAAMSYSNTMGFTGMFVRPTILQSWASVDPANAAKYYGENPREFAMMGMMGGGRGPGGGQAGASIIASEWAKQDPSSALAWAGNLTTEKSQAMSAVIGEVAKSDPREAAGMLASMNEENLGDAYRYSHTLFELAEPMYRNAIKLGKERLGINPSDAYTLSALGHFHASVGERELALQYMAKAEVLAPQDMYIYYYSATTLAALNELDRAVLALEKSIALGYSADMVRVDAGLAVLRDHPDFEALTVQ
jgi:tetratricopeptide (TPR) repeat protein